jgi:hypothetical protein
MHPCLQRGATARHGPEHLAHGLRSWAQLLFLQHRARFIQQAVPARPIAQVQTDSQLLSQTFLICFLASVLTFFIAGLLYLLRLKERR